MTSWERRPSRVMMSTLLAQAFRGLAHIEGFLPEDGPKLFIVQLRGNQRNRGVDS